MEKVRWGREEKRERKRKIVDRKKRKIYTYILSNRTEERKIREQWTGMKKREGKREG